MDAYNELLVRIPYVLILFLFLWLGKLLYDGTTPFGFTRELTERDNPAFGVHLGLYLLGCLFALLGTLYGGVGYKTQNLVAVAVFSLVSILLMRVSVWVNDKLILRHFDIGREMIADRNIGTGFVVGGSCLATGLMINGSLSGESELSRGTYDPAGVVWLTEACGDLLAYFLLGQALLVAGALLFRWTTPYDIHGVLERDNNAAAGLSFGGFLVGLGIIVRAALVGASSDLAAEVGQTLAIAAGGLVILIGGRLLAVWALMPRVSMGKEIAADRNTAAAAVDAAVSVSLGLAYGTVITTASL